MKNLVTLLIVGFSIFGLTTTTDAQTKIGHISFEELIASMPEAMSADTALNDYQVSLEEQGEQYLNELKEKDSLYIKDSATLSPAKKELRGAELFELYQKVQNWKQIMQQKMGEKQQQLVIPIRDKAMKAINAVAKEKGYTHVLDSGSLIVMPSGDDILPAVRTKLGIKAPVAPKSGQ